MENKLEQLLNSLVKAGWKPYGKGIDELTEEEKNIRLITSRNSGLWQFVCENGMQRKTETYFTEKPIGEVYGISQFIDKDYEYWLIGSSLKDESELEDFLLSNIVIKDE